MYIKNKQGSSKFKGCSPLQVHRDLKDMCFETAYFSYTECYRKVIDELDSMKKSIENRKNP